MPLSVKLTCRLHNDRKTLVSSASDVHRIAERFTWSSNCATLARGALHSTWFPPSERQTCVCESRAQHIIRRSPLFYTVLQTSKCLSVYEKSTCVITAYPQIWSLLCELVQPTVRKLPNVDINCKLSDQLKSQAFIHTEQLVNYNLIKTQARDVGYQSENNSVPETSDINSNLLRIH